VLPEALAIANAVMIGPVNRAQLLADEDRLSPEAIATAVRARGRSAKAFDSADEIAEHIIAGAALGDVVMIMSNGSFDGLTGKVMDGLKARSKNRL